MSDTWNLSEKNGELLLLTDVTGRAAKTGHRLTIRMNSWKAVAVVNDGRPTAVDLAVDVDSMEVLSGEGGMKPLSGAEKKVARANALKSMNAKKHKTVNYYSTDVEDDGSTFRIGGTLSINGVDRSHPLTVNVNDKTFSCETVVDQTNFGIKPFSLMMGSLKVADKVEISITATVPDWDQSM